MIEFQSGYSSIFHIQSKFTKHEGGLQESIWNKPQQVSFSTTPNHHDGRINIWQTKKHRALSVKETKPTNQIPNEKHQATE